VTEPSVESTSSTPAMVINHIGITVPDVFAAIRWYERVFGFTVLMEPRELDATGNAETSLVFGHRFRKAYQAQMLTGSGVGLELFQVVDPPVEPPETDGAEPVSYRRIGPWHVCVTHPDVPAMLDRIRVHGGAVLTGPQEFVPGRPWRLAYATDPWGIVFEIMNHSFAEAFGNWPQPGQLEPPTMVDDPRPDDAP
jgi:catechol 2,3-dioxygenase-like lactoylglutathione lyase family enzyme